MSADQEIGEEIASISEGPVELSYRHANPADGNESILLQFGYADCEGRACLLIDAGRGVDLDRLLEPEDTLVGICLTHAHIDHYWSLPEVISADMPVFTSPDTAKVLADVFEVAEAEQGLRGGSDVTDRVQPVAEWTEVCPGVKIHPVPAGHTPGAVGFLIRFTDGEDSHDVLVTGDFTLNDCGGYPGLDPSLAADVEVLFLTGAIGDDPGSALTNGLGDALDAARSGGRTLVTASAFTGVQFATLLTAAAMELDLDIDLEIRLIGQTAKLYTALGYDDPHIELIPVYEDPHTCLSPGAITIAGPETPREDSSARLFREMKHDGDAALIQLITGGWSPIHAGGCHSTAYEFSMHPTEATLASVVEELEPVHTVVTHRRGSPPTWNEWPSVVWGPGDSDAYTLYRTGSWQTPPWMGGVRIDDTSGVTRLGSIAGDLFDQLVLPSIDRTETPSLDDEGIDVDALRDRLARSVFETVPNTSSSESPAEDTIVEDPTMSESDRPKRQIEHRVETIRADQDPGTEHPNGFEAALPDPTSIVSARARRNLFSDTAADGEQSVESDRLEDSTDEAGHDHTDTAAPTTESATKADDVAEPATATEGAADREEPTETPPSASTDAAAVDESRRASGNIDADEVSTVELSPLVNGLLSQALDAGADRSLFIADAVEMYLGALLRDGGVPCTSADLTIAIDIPEPLQPVVDEALRETEFDDVEEFAGSTLAGLLDTATPTIEVAFGRCESLLEAAVEGSTTAFSSTDDVVEAAILWAIETDALRLDS